MVGRIALRLSRSNDERRAGGKSAICSGVKIFETCVIAAIIASKAATRRLNVLHRLVEIVMIRQRGEIRHDRRPNRILLRQHLALKNRQPIDLLLAENGERVLHLRNAAKRIEHGCAHHLPPEVSPTALASLQAETRIVRGEATWVTRGGGYELVGQTRADLAVIQPGLDREAEFLGQIFQRDTIAPIIAAIRRAPAPGKPFVGAAPVPLESRGSRVELVLIDPKTLEAERKKNDGQSNEGPRFWAPVTVAAVGVGENIDDLTKTLALHSESLIPLASYFTMLAPESMMMAARGARGSGEAPSGGRGAGGLLNCR